MIGPKELFMSLFRFKSQKSIKKTILVIDDEATTLKLVKETLCNAGFEVLTAESGEAGLKIAQDTNPDVIITDVLMPSMDGFMLFKELKKGAGTKDKSVLVLSGRQNVGDTFRRFGADSFLTKPVDPKLLVSEVMRLIKK
jgi:two-component system, OmpR family, alkaline phosphatase synthesis response regulator PhoP